MYERILAEFKDEYRPAVLSSPKMNGGPWIIMMEDFLSDVETEAMVNETTMLIAKGKAGDERHDAVILSKPEDAFDPEECDSTQAWCFNKCMEQEHLSSVKRKVERLIGLPWKYAEELHLIQYVPGQRYGNHHDYDSEDVESIPGPRLFTLLFYLNDPVGGGETCFPSLNPSICVEPKRGHAVIWPQVLDHDPEIKDNRTWHEANAISEGLKYSSTVWYHLRDYSYADKIGCSILDDLENEEFYEDDEDIVEQEFIEAYYS